MWLVITNVIQDMFLYLPSRQSYECIKNDKTIQKANDYELGQIDQ